MGCGVLGARLLHRCGLGRLLSSLGFHLRFFLHSATSLCLDSRLGLTLEDLIAGSELGGEHRIDAGCSIVDR